MVNVNVRRTRELNIRVMGSDKERYVLIEGGKASLDWFSALIHTHASGQKRVRPFNCTRRVRAESIARTATGIYLHLLPRDHAAEDSERAAGRKWFR